MNKKKKSLVVGKDYQGDNNKTISEWVLYMRKTSLSPVHKFAKDHNISSSLVKKYESGQYDTPSPLIASNFCKHFSVTPTELVEQCKLSDDPHFDKNEYLQTLNSYYYNSPQNTISIESVKNYIDVKTYDKYPKTPLSKSSFDIPCEVVFEGKYTSRIAGAFFKYEKIHKKQRVLDAYNYLANSIVNATLVKFSLIDRANTAPYIINNFLFVVSSKNAFNAIFREKRYFYPNIANSNQPHVNIILMLLPKYNSKNYFYFSVIGADFIQEKEHYYNKEILPNDENE